MPSISENQNRAQYISTNHSKIFTKEFKQDYKTATEAYKNMSASHKNIVKTGAYIVAQIKADKYSGRDVVYESAGEAASYVAAFVSGLLVIPAVAGLCGMYKGHKLGKLATIQKLQNAE
jgi:hypothetical protein